MSFARVLIANRGEIAIRIARAAAEAGIESVAVHATDDAQSPHVAAADRAVALPGAGARAYLDIPALIAAARAEGCDALHPGYGFLSENPGLAPARRLGSPSSAPPPRTWRPSATRPPPEPWRPSAARRWSPARARSRRRAHGRSRPSTAQSC